MKQLPVNSAIVTAVSRFYQQVNTQRVWIGFSGGLDSTVLLHALVKLKPPAVQLTAVHIHHGLQASADDWVNHCQRVCSALNIELVVRYVEIDLRDNIECAARNARYQAFAECVGAQDVLCIAHHQRDQAETFVLNLMRGAGVVGLSAMPEKRRLNTDHQAWLWRPLLEIPYNQFHDYAKSIDLVWVEDVSNQDTQLRRNWVRHQLLPVLQQQWPDSEAKIGQATRNLAEATELLEALAEYDLAQIEHDHNKFDWQALQIFSWARQKNIIQYWFNSQHQLRIDNATLDWLREACFVAPATAAPKRKLLMGEIRRYQQFVFYVNENEQQQYVFDGLEFCDLTTPRFSLQVTHGDGVAQKWFEAPHHVSVRCLQSTDKLNRDSLKKWFQSQRIPPWKRALWPVLIVDGQLAAVANYRVMTGFEAQLDEKSLKLVGLN